ncbi:response regulator transcription factor [Burkholderia anthina]|uniref:response regulator transcription factor n=1 Tax=Burkholderia anthina TaxID=179879 RepID=UPI0007C6367C|nr:response regulator [Burkholderia anthina]
MLDAAFPNCHFHASEPPTVFIVSNDASLTGQLSALLPSIGLRYKAFDNPFKFLHEITSDVPGCIVLDVRLPGMSGLDLQSRFVRESRTMPFIFVTAYGDIPMTVKAMRAGAIDFIPIPFREQDLLDSIALAMDRDRARRSARNSFQDLRGRFERLTQRERQVMEMVAAGLLNKQIASHMNRSEMTIKLHRRQVMAKMEAESLADLVRMAQRLGLGRVQESPPVRNVEEIRLPSVPMDMEERYTKV